MSDMFRRNSRGSPTTPRKKKGLFSRGSSKTNSPASSNASLDLSGSNRVGHLPSRNGTPSKGKGQKSSTSLQGFGPDDLPPPGAPLRADSLSSVQSLPTPSPAVEEEVSAPPTPTVAVALSPEAKELHTRLRALRDEVAQKERLMEQHGTKEEHILRQLAAMSVSQDTERRNTIIRERRMTASSSASTAPQGTEDGSSGDEESERLWSQSQGASDDDDAGNSPVPLNGSHLIYGRLGTGASSSSAASTPGAAAAADPNLLSPLSSNHSSPRRRMSSVAPGMRPSLNKGRRTVRLVRTAPGEPLGFSLKTVALPKNESLAAGALLKEDDYYEPTFISSVDVSGLSHFAGLRAGDQILAVDGEPCALAKHKHIVALVQKNTGSIALTVQYTSDFERARRHKERIAKVFEAREKASRLKELEEREKELCAAIEQCNKAKAEEDQAKAEAAKRAAASGPPEPPRRGSSLPPHRPGEGSTDAIPPPPSEPLPIAAAAAAAAAAGPAKTPPKERQLPRTPSISIPPPPPHVPLPPTPPVAVSPPKPVPVAMPELPDLPCVDLDFCTFKAIDSPEWADDLRTLVKSMQVQWKQEREAFQARERLLIAAIRHSPVPAPRRSPSPRNSPTPVPRTKRASSLSKVKKPEAVLQPSPSSSQPPPSSTSPSGKPPLAPKPAALAGKAVVPAASNGPPAMDLPPVPVGEDVPPPPSLPPPPPPAGSDVQVLDNKATDESSFA